MEKLCFSACSSEERKKFYEKEFDLQKVRNWFKKNKISIPKICAIDAGSDSKVIENRNFLGFMFYVKFSELKEKIKKYNPEDIYYDRNKYENFAYALDKLEFNNWKEQELVFDIDADNIECGCKKLCEKCLEKAFCFGKEMQKKLEENFGFKKIEIVYSGEGFHIHVLDRKAFLLKKKDRKKITEKFKKFPIDSWVSQGNINLIRLPYSLNGLVSRICLPISCSETNWKKIEKKTIPNFMKN